ncbi:MAG: YidC/Oxa1 family membrane protein insertase [Patescibacteria group bacterium]
MIAFWHNVLFAPLLNLLIVLYNGPAFGSLAIAVIELTILIRLALLPFTILSERNKKVYATIQKEVDRLEHEFKNDPVQKREELRKTLKKYHLNPWAKAALLGAQLVVLILLYQVFLGGINAKFAALYPGVAHPDYINTMFFGFDLGDRHNLWGRESSPRCYLLKFLLSRRSGSCTS